MFFDITFTIDLRVRGVMAEASSCLARHQVDDF